MSVENRIRDVKSKIFETCQRVGRKNSEVQLVAVSKKKSLSEIREAFECGQMHFGENYVQEALPKIEQLENLSIHWHFIGPLQSNKVRKIVGLVDLIHSVDRISLMKEISRQASQRGIRQKILLQVNVALEVSKSGIGIEELPMHMEEALKLEGIEVCGLMSMPPMTDVAEQNRRHFQRMKRLFVEIRERFFKDNSEAFSQLSMGTSQDFEIAIEEGATLVRVGSEIFGSRE